MSATTKVNPPTALAHIVLRTAQFKEMVSFYKNFLGASASYENETLSFLSYDHEHHRIAIGYVPGTRPKDPTSSGLEHIAFAYPNLQELATAYKQRSSLGIEPFWSVNHGPTTSMYYKDPDNNQIEIQVDNFDTPDEATQFMLSPLFKENPFGTDFEPSDLIKRLEAGQDEKSIKKRPEIGPRGFETLPL